MQSGAQHHIEIDGRGFRAVVARAGRNGAPVENGSPLAPSCRTTSFAVASSPHATATTGRACAHLARPVTHFITNDPSRHGSIGVGASAGLFGKPLLFGRRDAAADHSFPRTHYRRPLAQAPRLDGRNMRAATVCRTLQPGASSQ